MDYARIRAIGKEGHAFRRKSWDATTFAFERPECYIDGESIRSIKSLPAGAREAIAKIAQGDLVLFKSHLSLFSVHPKTGKGSVENAYHPSHEDLDATDWEVFEG